MKTNYVLLVLGWTLIWGVNTALAAPPVQNDAGGEYTVQPGDCLAKIAERYLDALYLEVAGVPVRSDMELLHAVDGQYLVLQQGDSYELNFDVATLAGNNTSVEPIIVSAGYYKNLEPTSHLTTQK